LFLDELCNAILELELGKGTVYIGNYSSHLEQKEHDFEIVRRAYTEQQKEMKRKKAVIERFRSKASKARMAQSMIKALKKIKLIQLPPSSKDVHFTFPPIRPSGRIVLTVNNVSHAFGDKTLFKNVNFTIERGHKVALIAPNGVGKTTLFDLIIGRRKLQLGTIEFGYNVTCAKFDQDQTKVFDSQQSVIDNLHRLCPSKPEQVLRTFLGSFLLTSSDVEKPVEVLSGGEKNRIGMINVLLQDANLLLLDEPTNHLDIPSKEILLKALQKYKETIFFVSHDRDFVNMLATHIIELTPEGAHWYHGNYDSYVYQKDGIQIETKVPSEKAKPKIDNKKAFELRKQIKRFERKIDKLEREIATLQQNFSEFTYGTQEFTQAEQRLNNLKSQLSQTMDLWKTALSADH